MHKLLEKGHVKFHRVVNNPDKRAYLYILTPAGLKAKSHLTYSFLKFTLNFYNQVEVKLRHCLEAMAQAGVQKVVLCGASEAVRIVLGLGGDHGIEVVGVLAGDGDQLPGVPLMQSEDLRVVEWDGVLITALEELDGVEAQLRDWGLPENKIWRLS